MVQLIINRLTFGIVPSSSARFHRSPPLSLERRSRRTRRRSWTKRERRDASFRRFDILSLATETRNTLDRLNVFSRVRVVGILIRHRAVQCSFCETTIKVSLNT